MRLPALVATAAALTLAGCGQSGTTSQTGSPQGPGAPPAPAMSAEGQQKALAALPAPYNTADLANGEAKFALCKSCHTVVAGGANMTGPNLHGVVGRAAAQVAGFKYSDAMKASGITWTPDKIDPYIEKPADLIPGNKMTFAGLKDAKDRTDVIAWLMVNAGSQP